MAKDADWRHAKTYDYVDQLEPASLAWEFLRRNPKYEDDYENIPKQKRDSASDTLTNSWGLRFPGITDPSRHQCGHLLLPAHRSWATASDFAAAGHLIG